AQIECAPALALRPPEDQHRAVLRTCNSGKCPAACIAQEDRIVGGEVPSSVACARGDVLGSPATARAPARMEKLTRARAYCDVHRGSEPHAGRSPHARCACKRSRVHVLRLPRWQPATVEVHPPARSACKQRYPPALPRY